MAPLKQKWDSKKLGTIIGSLASGRQRLTYLMFADDTTLLARSRQALQIMLRDIIAAMAAVGLNINADKCALQTSCSRNRQSTMT
eukprot:7020806-Karenia_brevis.AAC.1